MAKTISTIFEIQDKYTKTINKIINSTANAEKKINKVSRATDKFNEKMNKLKTPPTERITNAFDKIKSKADSASGSIGRLVKIVASIATAKVAMGIIDNTTLTNARLSMINDGTQTDKQLQNKIMQSADSSRSLYASTAANVSKLGLLAPEAFNSNNEIIKFSELLNKSFKVGGAGTQEQEAGTYQLTQAMAAGKLQGDEFRSVMENAPLVAQAIADYTGKTKGELKEMSSQGTITADIIKNAMFASAKQIEDRYKKLPKTFGDYWTLIKNKAVRAFNPVIEKINEMINTPQFEEFFNNLSVGIQLGADAVSSFIDGLTWLYQTLEPFAPLIGAVVLALAAYKIGVGLATEAQAIFNTVTTLNPIGILAVGIVALAALLIYLGYTNEDVAYGIIYAWDLIQVGLGHAGANLKLLWASLQSAMYFFLYAGQSVVVDFLRAWYGLQNGIDEINLAILKNIQSIVNGFMAGVKLIADVANKFGANIDIGFEQANFADNMEKQMNADKQNRVASLADWTNKANGSLTKALSINTTAKSDYMNEVADIMKEMSELDKTRNERVKNRNNWIDEVQEKINGALDLGNETKDKLLGKSSNAPVKVDGGKLDSAGEVNISDEDLKYLKDFAEQEFVNKFTQATLAPNVNIQFGDIHENADAEKVKDRIKQILEEEIAEVAEGVYS